MYKADTLEEMLKDYFGYYFRMFDYPNIGTSYYNIVVIATIIATILT